MNLKKRIKRIEKALETPSQEKHERALAAAFRDFGNPEKDSREALKKIGELIKSA